LIRSISLHYFDQQFSGVEDIDPEINIDIGKFYFPNYLNLCLVCSSWYKAVDDVIVWKKLLRLVYKPKILTKSLSTFSTQMTEKEIYKHLCKKIWKGKFLIFTNFEIKRTVCSDIKSWLKKSGLKNVDIMVCPGEMQYQLMQEPDQFYNRLSAYDALFVFSDGKFKCNDFLGNTILKIVNEGIGIVQAVFLMCSWCESLGGEWKQKNLNPIFPRATNECDGTQISSHFQLGKIIKPHHFILNSVKTFEWHYISTGYLHPQADIIAYCKAKQDHELEKSEDDEMYPFLATLENQAGKIVALNVYPTSTRAYVTGWEERTDGGALLSNALLYAAKHK